MNTRPAVRAGAFYEGNPANCRRHARKLLDAVALPPDLPATLYGGIVPHAGWTYSGKLAAMTVRAVLAQPAVTTIVLLGADHFGTVRKGEVYDSGAWQTPLGEAEVDAAVASAVLAAGGDLRSNPAAHAEEHSLEVLIPLLQVAREGIKIVPIGVPPTELAVRIGQVVGWAVGRFPHVRVIGSTDLTHHAGHFPAPGGRGLTGVQWTEANDKRMVDLLVSMEAAQIISEAEARGNACGAGAAAAAVAACRQMGAERGLCLGYTNSYRVVHDTYPHDPDDTTVGYASVVFA
jgi:MEMO1 family protein